MQVAQDLVQLGFEYLQGQALQNFFRQPFPVLDCATNAVFFKQMDLKEQLFYISFYYQFFFLLQQ